MPAISLDVLVFKHHPILKLAGCINMTNVTKTMSSSVFLWMRDDLPREQTFDYWRGPHSQLVARNDSFEEYRQHHFLEDEAGFWPNINGVCTQLPANRKIDGMPEVTFKSAITLLNPFNSNKAVLQDEKNVFKRTILHATGPTWGRWYKSGYGEDNRFRVVVLLRRSPRVSSKVFRHFVNDQLGPALASQKDLTELRSQVFMPWTKAMWNSPDVLHDYPVADQYHASLVLAGPNRKVVQVALDQVNQALAEPIAKRCAGIHAYVVKASYVYRKDGRPTLPQISPVKKPQLQPVFRKVKKTTTNPKSKLATITTSACRKIMLPGPSAEDVISTANGTLIYGLPDGRVYEYKPSTDEHNMLVNTKGSTLGLENAPDNKLIICDAHKGLLITDKTAGNLATLTQYVNEIPLRFCSNAARQKDGTIWFSESSTRYDLEHYLADFLEHRPSGRLLRRDPNGKVTVIHQQLYFPNGVVLSPDESALYFSESAGYRISKLNLSGVNKGKIEVIADNLPGIPDNMTLSSEGLLWVAMTTMRNPLLDKLGTSPAWLRKLLWRISDFVPKTVHKCAWAMAFDMNGQLVHDIYTEKVDFHMCTGVTQLGNKLYLSSIEEDSLLEINLEKADSFCGLAQGQVEGL